MLSEPDLPPPFEPYEVPGVGTVIAPEGEPGYRVRLPDGQVTAFPAHSGDPCEANAAADIAYAIAHPPGASPEQVWAEKLASVIVDGPTGIAINADIRTRGLMGDTLNLLREAEFAGYVTGATAQQFWDAEGVQHIITVADLRGLILRYGIAWQAMFAEFAP